MFTYLALSSSPRLSSVIIWEWARQVTQILVVYFQCSNRDFNGLAWLHFPLDASNLEEKLVDGQADDTWKRQESSHKSQRLSRYQRRYDVRIAPTESIALPSCLHCRNGVGTIASLSTALLCSLQSGHGVRSEAAVSASAPSLQYL